MKFTLNWLKEYLETSASLDEIAAALTNIGLEVEEIEDRAARYAAFTTARVLSAEKHPDADRLKVCQVETIEGIVQVVCGAPNARTGMIGVFAPAGTYIPGTDVHLKKGVIRGQASNGMLVSEREMGISDEHQGIIDLPADTKTGVSLADLYNLNDVVIEIGLTPNRADCTGIYGIARDLAAAGIGTLKPVTTAQVNCAYACPVNVRLALSENDKSACPHFCGRMIRGVKNGTSPQWLRDRLKAIGLRPISVLVDITNFMTYAYGRPLHVFDTQKLKGDISVRLSSGGEHFDALNDKTYTLAPDMTMICDESGLLGLGGIVGGTSTAVDENTCDVFVEAAYFDPIRIARTGRSLQINSDARYRFERGVDPDFTRTGLDIAVNMICELCGGEPSELIEVGAPVTVTREIKLPVDKTEKLVGINIPPEKQKEILQALGCEIKAGTDNEFSVITPSWRGDLEYPECLVEEIVRLYGLEHVRAVSVRDYFAAPVETSLTGMRKRLTRTSLVKQGLFECVTWSFLPSNIANLFGANDNAALRLSNPISADLDTMRPSILPNLLLAARENARKGAEFCALFEIGPAFRSCTPDGQDNVCGLLRTGVRSAKNWSDPGSGQDVDIFDIKEDVRTSLVACGAPENLQITRDAPQYYHPGRSGTFRLGKNVLAYFGELHPQIAAELDIDMKTVAGEIFLENIPAPRQKAGSAKSLLKLHVLQPLTRDFAFILDHDIEAENVIRAIKSVEKQMITDVQVFDVYQGKGIAPGKKSLALSVTLQPNEKTLTDSEIEHICAEIISNVQSKTGGELRT